MALQENNLTVICGRTTRAPHESGNAFPRVHSMRIWDTMVQDNTGVPLNRRVRRTEFSQAQTAHHSHKVDLRCVFGHRNMLSPGMQRWGERERERGYGKEGQLINVTSATYNMPVVNIYKTASASIPTNNAGPCSACHNDCEGV